MNKPKFNIQDQFLNQVRKDGTVIVAELITGKTVEGNVRGFDNFCLLIESEKQQHLIYKHALSNIRPRDIGKVKLGTHE